MGRNSLLMQWVRGERPDWFKASIVAYRKETFAKMNALYNRNIQKRKSKRTTRRTLKKSSYSSYIFGNWKVTLFYVWVDSQVYWLNILGHFCLSGWLKFASLLWLTMIWEELQGRIQKIISSMPHDFLVKSDDAILGWLEKLVAKSCGMSNFIKNLLLNAFLSYVSLAKISINK